METYFPSLPTRGYCPPVRSGKKAKNGGAATSAATGSGQVGAEGIEGVGGGGGLVGTGAENAGIAQGDAGLVAGGGQDAVKLNLKNQPGADGADGSDESVGGMPAGASDSDPVHNPNPESPPPA